MTDIVDKATRSRMMSKIKSKDTGLEVAIRKGLWKLGHRYFSGQKYHIDGKKLPGRPDMVFPKHRAVIFANGCYWHGHDCHLFRLPSTNTSFWSEKINSNRARDKRNNDDLKTRGWRVMVVWECAFRGKEKLVYNDAVKAIEAWLISDSQQGELRGREGCYVSTKPA